MGNFNLHDSNTASYAYVTDANNAFASKKRTDDTPADNRGPAGAYNKIVITAISIDVAGYSNSGSVNFGVWSSGGGTNYYASSSITGGLGAVGATSSVPSKSYTIPMADRFQLTGNTIYYFGVHNENTGGITVQKNTSSSGDLGLDQDHANASSDLSGTTWDPAFRAGYTLVGTITYVYLPSQPLTPSITGGKKQALVSWTAPSDDGDSAVTKYLVHYKKSADSTWTTIDTGSTALNYTITGLDANTSYDTRVSAWNAASDVIGVSSEYSSTVTANTAPGGPSVWSNTAWVGSEILVCTSNGTWSSAASAEMFVCTSENPVVWTPLS